MKKIILFVVAMVAAVSAIASDQVYVIMKDGSVESYPGDKVDSITIEPHQNGKNINFKAIASEIDTLKKDIEMFNFSGAGNAYQYSVSGYIDGHAYVDLGLPSGLKWATMNVGARKENARGTAFAWGEIAAAPNNDYSSANCRAYNKSSYNLENDGVIDKNGNLTAKYDAATQNWGENWKMPTCQDFTELMNYCTWTWTSLGGVKGYKVASKVAGNTSWIFIPADSCKKYWSTTIYKDSYNFLYWTYNSVYFYFSSSEKEQDGVDARYNGFCVRPVSK